MTFTWESETLLHTENFSFRADAPHDRNPPPPWPFPIRKPRVIIERYYALLAANTIQNVLEIGYLYGGFALLLADLLPKAKVVGVDIRPEPALVHDRARYYGGSIKATA